MKIDLGYTPHYLSHSLSGSEPETGKKKKKEEPIIVFPSIHLEGEAAKVIGRNVVTDGEFTALVTFRVVSKREQAARSREYGGKEDAGCHTELELRSINSSKLKEGEEDDGGESAEAAADAYFGK